MPLRVIGSETVDITNYFCDGCGCEFEDQSRGRETGKEGSLSAKFDFGYYSERDGVRFEWYFCQDCAEEVLKYIQMMRGLKNVDR